MRITDAYLDAKDAYSQVIYELTNLKEKIKNSKTQDFVCNQGNNMVEIYSSILADLKQQAKQWELDYQIKSYKCGDCADCKNNNYCHDEDESPF